MLIILLSVVLLSCKKDKIIVSAVLTDCPAGNTCTYNYYDNANFKGPQQLVAGSARVFYFNSVTNNSCGSSWQLYFKTALSNNDFVISKSQVAAGQALYNFSCPCCYIAYVPHAIGGEIKGKKTGSNQWLINATIIIADPNNTPVDTLKVNQYFNLTKLP
ncbi:hypothetical protein BH09BAC6_BH09BAC6_14650 [soil metagenome]|jgi:hypothetical protein